MTAKDMKVNKQGIVHISWIQIVFFPIIIMSEFIHMVVQCRLTVRMLTALKSTGELRLTVRKKNILSDNCEIKKKKGCDVHCNGFGSVL